MHYEENLDKQVSAMLEWCEEVDYSHSSFWLPTGINVSSLLYTDIFLFISLISFDTDTAIRLFRDFFNTYMMTAPLHNVCFTIPRRGLPKLPREWQMYFLKAFYYESRNRKEEKASLEYMLQKAISFFRCLGQFLYDHYPFDISSFRVEECVNLINDGFGSSFASEKNIFASLHQTEEPNLLDSQEESLEDLLSKLNSLVGLENVKREIKWNIDAIRYAKKHDEKRPPLSRHLVFYGNPGTGKTMVARLIAKIYKCLGVLSTGQCVETDRGGLVAEYIGQTAKKTQEMVDKAMGGVLFIDEAYSLTQGTNDKDFGHEAVATLLKAMEDHRDDFIVIVAGYPDLMRDFLSSNPGLKSRFDQFIEFEDYTPGELLDIFLLYCKNSNLSISSDCFSFLQKHFEEIYVNRNNDYGNARDVRKYFEKVYKAHASRIASGGVETQTITLSDLYETEKLINAAQMRILDSNIKSAEKVSESQDKVDLTFLKHLGESV